MTNLKRKSKNSYRTCHSKSKSFHTNRVKLFLTSIPWSYLWEKLQSNIYPYNNVLNNQTKNLSISRKKTHGIKHVIIIAHSIWSDYYHLWTSIFWRSIWEKIPIQDSSIWSKFWKIRRRIDKVQGKILWWIEKVFIRTHSRWNAHYNLWTSIFWISLWEISPSDQSFEKKNNW